jgi:hypothetical protein
MYIKGGHCSAGHPMPGLPIRTLEFTWRERIYSVQIKSRPVDWFKNPLCGKCLFG